MHVLCMVCMHKWCVDKMCMIVCMHVYGMWHMCMLCVYVAFFLCRNFCAFFLHVHALGFFLADTLVHAGIAHTTLKHLWKRGLYCSHPISWLSDLEVLIKSIVILTLAQHNDPGLG